MSGVRAFFIDGPDHGTTRTFESEPPHEWLTVCPQSLQATMTARYGPVYGDPQPRHRYLRTYKTRKGVYVYEYDGMLA